MNKEQLKRNSEEAFHSQRILVWIVIEFVFFAILAISIIYRRS